MVGRAFLGWMIGAGFVLTIGCGGDAERGRVPLHGSVYVEGERVTEGSISLLPAQGHSGPAASTSITNGQYAFTKETGPTAGPHRAVVGVMTTEKPADLHANAASGDEQQGSDATLQSATEGGPKGNPASTGESAADRSASPTQWEMEFDVPSEGDYRADLEFGTK